MQAVAAPIAFSPPLRLDPALQPFGEGIEDGVVRTASRRARRAHHQGCARGEGEAAEALRPLRHLLLPDLHAGRARHARRGLQRRRAGVHLARVPRASSSSSRTRCWPPSSARRSPRRAAPTSGSSSRSGASRPSINSVLYWLSNPIWLGGTLTILAVTTFGDFFTPLTGVWKYLFSLAFIWFAVWAAILSFGVGKWIPTIGAWVRIGVLGVLHAHRDPLRDRPTACTASARGDFKPTWAIFIAAVPGAVLQLRRLRAAQRRRATR